jgi:hypothetical protein
MSYRYQRIFSQIWHDEKFRACSEDARSLFLYLLTSPHSNALGLYVLPKPYIEADLGWDSKRLAKPFRELLDKGFIFYDDDTATVLIKNHLKHNPIENRNQAIACVSLLEKLPKTTLIHQLFEGLKPFAKPFMEPLIQRLAKPLPIRYAKPETETETEYINIYISSPSPPDEPPDSPPADIDSQKAKRKDIVPYQQIIDLWNKHAPQPLPRASLTEKRKPKIRAAWKEYPSLEWWKELFSDIVYSPWHSHQDRWQGNSFDWMVKNRTEMREKLNALKAQQESESLPSKPTPTIEPDPPGIMIPSPDCLHCGGTGLARDGPCECLHPENPDDPYWQEHPENLLRFKRAQKPAAI